jgi:putative thioredoxin
VDGFVGSLPESQVRAFVQKLSAGAGADDGIEEALKEAEALLAQGQGGAAPALEIYQSILAEELGNLPATAGMLRALLALGRRDEAKKVLDGLPAEIAGKAEIAAVRAGIELAVQGDMAGATAELESRLAADPNDHQARFDLAAALFAAGKREGAVEQLLELVRRKRSWNEDAARKQLVKLFEAMGPTDPLTVDTRKRLSSLLFA